MTAICLCAQPDSFNVRVGDLINPRCPVHGAPIIEADKATPGELQSLVAESLRDVNIGGRVYAFIDTPNGIAEIVRNLLARYDIRRK